MTRATITYTKNNLSRLLGLVKEGETVLVMDRHIPVARIEAVDPHTLAQEDRLRMLVADGTVCGPRHPLDVTTFLDARIAEPRQGGSAVAAALRDREESP